MKKTLLVVFCLLMALPMTSLAQHGLTGFATYADLGLEGTTGGGAGTVVRVSTREALAKYAAGSTPYVIIIENDLEGKGVNDVKDELEIGSNKTIVGAGDGVTLKGICFNVKNQQNIIIRNIAITKGKPDGMAFRNTHHVWVDHCDLSQCDDGMLDLTVGSSYLTVSWTKFHDHDKAALCNSGTQHFEDRGKNRATYHHCSFVNTNQRNPRVGYGLGHVYNCYWESNGSYCVGYHTGAKMVVENGYFYNTKEPFNQMYAGTDKTLPSYADALSVGNVFVGTSGNQTGTGVGFDTSIYYDHDFALDKAEDVPGLKDRMGLVAGIENDIIPFPGDGAVGVPLSVKLSCGAIDGATDYLYYIGKDEATLEPYNAATYKLDAATTYFWQAKAVTADSIYVSEVFRFTTAPEIASNPTPANGTLTAALREAVEEFGPCQPMKLRWNRAADATLYRIYLSTSSEPTSADFVGETTETSIAVEPLTYGTPYSWRVDVVKGDGTVVEGEVWTFSSEICYADFGRVECENMVRNGIAFINNPAGWFSCSNNLITMGEAGPGSLSAVWKGSAAICDITTSHFDENDGKGWYGIYVNEEKQDEWFASTNNNKIVTHQSKGITLKPGDELRLEFYTQSGEQSRTDCIDIVKVADATGIADVVTDQNAPLRIYSLDGRYLGNSLEGLKKGIYIVNGRKIVVGHAR